MGIERKGRGARKLLLRVLRIRCDICGDIRSTEIKGQGVRK